MRYIYLLVFLLGTLTSQGQNLPLSGSEAAQMARSASTEQLSSYVSKARAEGYSLLEVKNIIRAQGASTSDLALLEELWNTTTITTERITENTEDFSSNFGMFAGQGEGMEKIEEKGATRFGENYFSYAKPLETPELYLATPADYQLGPGDEILVELYGASEESYPLQISRQGTIKVERLAPVYLSGLSIASAQRRLEARFSEIYTGLKASSNDPSKVTLSLSLQKARSVVVNITGQVKAPGTYTLSGFSSPLNALYAAGGPNEVGTYRKVRLLRGGKLFQEIETSLNPNSVRFESRSDFYMDNKSAICIAETDETKKSKHIDIRDKYIKSQMDSIRIKYVNTDSNIADALTKSVAATRLRKLFRALR